ncbi:hypothetical protein ISN45_Aa08g027550 [Arabidopsis thaliana x Arabidopsis arenosa]|uniref:Uncharacterized protein n=1 Tax=Arabidopsis thaliana x Arabidopsis arenosa TaxID=1240361 RepID=A0A8T1XL09_9BRAS|nr:hypothetical protein ISN45_Aa08g027550 [Arabidopsis thaliana x Arabidopsis arenosa]
MAGFLSLDGGKASRGLASRTSSSPVSVASILSSCGVILVGSGVGSGEAYVQRLSSSRRDHSPDLRNRWCIAVFFSHRRCSFCGWTHRFCLGETVLLFSVSLSSFSPAPVVSSLDKAGFSIGGKPRGHFGALSLFVAVRGVGDSSFGGQRVSSIGGLLKVVASSAMGMASPCPFVFVPVASSPVCFKVEFCC